MIALILSLIEAECLVYEQIEDDIEANEDPCMNVWFSLLTFFKEPFRGIKGGVLLPLLLLGLLL